jgi:hypothetical protein
MEYSETSTHTTSLSGSSYSAAAPLRNVQFDPSNTGVIEEQQQKIKHLQEQLAKFNRVRYRTLPANASGGKNSVRTSKRKSLTATDQKNSNQWHRIYGKPFGHQTRFYQQNGVNGGRIEIVCVK